MAALGSSFISCTAPDKNLGVQPSDTLIAESPWVVAPGAYLAKLVLVCYISDPRYRPVSKTSKTGP